MGAVTAFWAPAHRALARQSNPSAAGFPLNAAPSLDFAGHGIQDHRLPYNARGSSSVQPGIIGWLGGPAYCETANYVPAVAAVANIAAAHTVASGVPMTLVSSSGSGVVVATVAAPAFFPVLSKSVTAGVFIDALPTMTLFGSAGNFSTGFYEPSTCVGRGVSISGVSGGSGGAFLVSGLDIYGYPMTQTITVAAGANTVNSLKTFKAVLSVTPQFTDSSHNYSVGVADVYGFGLFTVRLEKALIWNNGTLITAPSSNFVVPDQTSPATAATGDVRGTYNGFTSDGTKRLVLYSAVAPGLINTNPTNGLFGQPQI